MLFTLVPAPLGSDGYQFPHASSVFITCALVSFFPSLDAASSLKKSVHRIGGTMIGSSLAIVLGFISLQIGHGTSGQAAFLGVILAIIFFAFPYYLAKTKNFTYAAGLGFVTGGLIALSFYNASPDRPWLYACYRTAALLVGCCISLIVSVVVLPKPIEEVIDEQMKMSMSLLGKSCKMILEAAGKDNSGVGDGNKLPYILDLITDNSQEDEIHDAYATAATLHTMGKSKLPLLKYDPFLLYSRRFDKKKIAMYGKQVQMQRARLNRLITSIVSMDSLFRLGIQEIDMEKYKLCDPLTEAGRRVEVVLGSDASVDDRNEAAHLLLVDNLTSIRQVRMSIEVKSKEDDGSFTKNIEGVLKGDTLPPTFYSNDDALCFFLRHVEHVIMSCIRLHYCFHNEDEGVVKDKEEV